MGEQAALTTSTGVIWLIVGGLLAATALAVLIPTLGLGSPVIATTGMALVLAFYAAMIGVRFAIPRGRNRLRLMAIAMIGIGLTALICVSVITAAEWDILR